MLYRLIVAAFVFGVVAYPAAAQVPLQDCKKIEKKDGAWTADKAFKTFGPGKCERKYTCAPKDSGSTKANLSQILACGMTETPYTNVGGVCDPLTGACTSCKTTTPTLNCSVILVKK